MNAATSPVKARVKTTARWLTGADRRARSASLSQGWAPVSVDSVPDDRVEMIAPCEVDTPVQP
jgi:hypothetical protein